MRLLRSEALIQLSLKCLMSAVRGLDRKFHAGALSSSLCFRSAGNRPKKLGEVLVPSPTVKMKGPNLRPLTALVQLGLRVIRLPVGRGARQRQLESLAI